MKCLAGMKCDWEGSLNMFITHRSTCQYTLLPCSNQCKDEKGVALRYYRKDLDEHLAVCPYRKTTCPHCEVTVMHVNIPSHDAVCTKKVVQCSNADCTVTMPRDQLDEHLKKDCQHSLLPCKYARIGCALKRKRNDLAEHEDDASMHLERAMETITTLKQKVAKMEVAQTKTDERLAKLEGRVLPVYTFEITNFESKKEFDRTYTSQTFYTGKEGYNLAIRVHLNGDSGVKGEALSVYVLVKKGRNDSFLPWPFAGLVTVTLLNQAKDKNHHSVTINMEDAESESFGCRKFIAQERLKYDEHTETRYLKGDTLYFKVYVDCKDSKTWLEPPSARGNTEIYKNFHFNIGS